MISRFPLKSVRHFWNFLAILSPPTLYKVETRKKFWIHASNIVCGVRGGVGPVSIGKRPRNAKLSQDFCPWLSEKEVGRKKVILRGFQACESVFSGFWRKIVIEETFSQLFGVFWTCFKNSLETNDIHQKLWNLIACALFQRITITLNETQVRHAKELGSWIYDKARGHLPGNNLLRDVNITVASTQYEYECQKIQ